MKSPSLPSIVRLFPQRPKRTQAPTRIQAEPSRTDDEHYDADRHILPHDFPLVIEKRDCVFNKVKVIYECERYEHVGEDHSGCPSRSKTQYEQDGADAVGKRCVDNVQRIMGTPWCLRVVGQSAKAMLREET